LSDDGQYRSDENSLSTTKTIGDECAREGTHKGSNLEGCYHSTFAGGIFRFDGTMGVDGIDLMEDLYPALESCERSRTSLIVTKDDKSRGDDEDDLGHA
jgi:hypothetical protein